MTRMTETEIKRALADVQTTTDKSALATQGLVDIESELDRARSEEAQFPKENAEKDAQIKALADALWDARAYGDTEQTACWCSIPSSASFCRKVDRNPGCVAKVAALRLAGRLP